MTDWEEQAERKKNRDKLTTVAELGLLVLMQGTDEPYGMRLGEGGGVVMGGGE